MANEYNVSLDRLRLGLALMRLSKQEESPIARVLYGKLVRAWDPMYGPQRNDRKFCTVKLGEHEVAVFASLAIPSLLHCTYTAVYVDPEDPSVEVKVSSVVRPKTKATFNVRGGKRRLTRTSIHKHRTEENDMARKPNTDELDDLDDLDLDGDDEDEAPAPKAKKGKAETAAEKRRRLKAEAAAAEAEDDEDEDDAEDEDEDEDEDDEPEPPKKKAKPAAKSAAKPKSKGTPVGRALPEGKFGVEQVAELAGTSGRAVRIYCRTNDIEKAEGLGRYAWTEKQATALAKKIKVGSK